MVITDSRVDALARVIGEPLQRQDKTRTDSQFRVRDLLRCSGGSPTIKIDWFAL
jgi:hypothetical protein